MTGLLAALRGLLHRAGISLNILLVAVVAVAAVSIGPAYYAAAQSSVVQDTVGRAPPRAAAWRWRSPAPSTR